MDTYPVDRTSWVTQATISWLATVALEADDILSEPEGKRAGLLEIAREQRRIALDELIRRGAIESYSFV